MYVVDRRCASLLGNRIFRHRSEVESEKLSNRGIAIISTVPGVYFHMCVRCILCK